ncbi:MAG TPA: alcohol dehydrogenase catalytic domain-containing protein [Pseudomonadota bacterium]|nr:alcohol dehydrogenase catalytic domain-containing protein [Pseudomonadota bacterium]
MRALVLSQTLSYCDSVPDPIPTEGEALVAVRQAGICNTDVELLRGYMGFSGIPGHEFVGTLLEVPPGHVDEAGRPLETGCRVVAEINCSPPPSPPTAALRAHDPCRTTLGIFRRNGAFAQYLTVPVQNLHRVPDEVSDDQAIFVEPLAAALQIPNQVHMAPTDHVAVLGDGKLGLLCAQVLAHASAAKVTAIGKHPHKLALLSGHPLATRLLSQLGDDAAARFDVVVDCTGSPSGLSQAIKILRPRGTLVLKSTYAPPSVVKDNANGQDGAAQFAAALTQIVIDEISVVGSRCGPFAAALRLLAQKRIIVDPMISARYALSDGLAAFADAMTKSQLKVVLTP